MGMNYYTSELGEDGVEGGSPSRGRDMGTILSKDPSWPESASSWLRVCTFVSFSVHPHTYLFISSPYSQFLPINHSQHLSFFPLFTFHIQYTLSPNGTDTDKLIAFRLVPKLPLWLEFMKFCFWGHIMSQMNSVNMLMPYIHKIHSNINFSPSLWPNGWGFSTKSLHQILTSIMQNKCPFC